MYPGLHLSHLPLTEHRSQFTAQGRHFEVPLSLPNPLVHSLQLNVFSGPGSQNSQFSGQFEHFLLLSKQNPALQVSHVPLPLFEHDRQLGAQALQVPRLLKSGPSVEALKHLLHNLVVLHTQHPSSS
jgi:hypothetical protein